jgi:hypothetical protein
MASGFGIRKMGERADVEPDTPFQAGSISKPVFALAVMRLYQDKRIDLDEGSFQKLGVKAIRLGSAMFARYGNTRWVDDVRFDAAHPQPAGQPEAVAASFEGYANALDGMACLSRLLAPALQEF